MIERIKKIKEKVQQLLTTVPHLRDDDNKLIATIWNQEIGKDAEGKSKTRSMSAFDMLHAMSNGQLTPADAITRARRKVQEQNWDLRGKSYRSRKNKQEETRKSIHQL